tara:strand:+ start:7718 stop:8578 length:861 start_codon:yes stop_codon:yes gene_type:complete
MAGNISISTDNSANHIFDNSDNTILLNSLYGDYQNIIIQKNSEWFEQIEYIIFRNEMKSIKKNYLVVLKECKENKRLLDLKYDDLNTIVNNIQTSVIFFSTFSGFLQATRIQFNISDTIISIISITISTYISLLLSISKYYKLDEMKEKIQVLREKFSLLHNKLDYQMDILGPWLNKHVWIHQDSKKKLVEWAELHTQLKEEYDGIIETKKDLVTEFEIIMDTKSRNSYFIKNRELNYKNRIKLNEWDKKESDLEASIQNTEISRPSISLKHEELDNWDDDMSDSD